MFIYSVQCGCKFLWLVCPTSDRHTMQREFCPPSQQGHSIVSASVTSMWCAAYRQLSSNSKHSLQPRRSYSWV